MTVILRAYDAATAVDRQERTIVATVNTDAVDRYRTVIVPEGGQFENYRRNPVVLYNHDGMSIPIGKNLWIKPQKRKIVAKTKFLPEGKDPLADKVFDLYDLGFLNAWSISFDPIDASSPTPEELRKNPDWAVAYTVYRKWDLLEYSVVTIPGNPEAVRAAQARGLALPGWPEPKEEPPRESDVIDLPPLGSFRTYEQVHASLVRRIRAMQDDGAARAAALLDLHTRGIV